MSQRVDVAINFYGKPAQTAVTLLSLLRHSGEHIARIHLTVEKRQPFGAELLGLNAYFGDRLTIHKPTFWFGVRPTRNRLLMRWGAYRRSLRYQAAWETTDRPYLFITHNDMLYTGDIIGALLGRIGGSIAAGPVGQCWNCPASFAGKCGPDRFLEFQPSYLEWQALAQRFPGPRAAHYERMVAPQQPWPLPECRVNEWSVLIDMVQAWPATMPAGSAVPFGALFGLDIGTQWFHDVVNQGLSVKHVDVAPFATHAWASSTGGGHAALGDRATYDREEALAKAFVQEHFREAIDAGLRLD
ncbi:MAG: hypothetical protein R2818_00370 [Flavobacteriales bacterium]